MKYFILLSYIQVSFLLNIYLRKMIYNAKPVIAVLFNNWPWIRFVWIVYFFLYNLIKLIYLIVIIIGFKLDSRYICLKFTITDSYAGCAKHNAFRLFKIILIYNAKPVILFWRNKTLNFSLVCNYRSLAV